MDEAIKQLAGGDLLVSKEGVFIKANGHYRATAPLDIDNHKMENLPDPVDEKDAVNKKYVDDVTKSLMLEEALIKENGGYNIASAYINMNFNNIKNLGNPKHEADAVPRKFVDDVIKEVEEKVYKKKKQLITATASYHGDLIKGDYQFTWGGQSMDLYKEHDVFNGFLIPSSGYIKKFVVLDTGIKLNTQKDRDGLEYIIYDLGLNTHVPLFTLVLIRHLKEPVDIGTLYFYFFDYSINQSGGIRHVFKFNPDFEEKKLRTVRAKDVFNIRSEFNSIDISGYRIIINNINYKYGAFNFFTYLATLLIELDPLEGEDDEEEDDEEEDN